MGDVSITQEIVATDAGTVKDSRQTVNLSTAEQKLYFDLKLVEHDHARPVPEGEQAEVHTLQPGKSYQVQVFCGNPYPERYVKQVGIVIETTIEFRLQFGGNTELLSIISIDGQVQLERKAVPTFKANNGEFTFTVPADCPRGEAEIHLLYKEVTGSNILKPATIMVVQVAGTRNPIDSSLKEMLTVTIDTAFPEHVATLYVTQPGERQLQLHGWTPCSDLLTFVTHNWEPLRLADLDQKEPLEIKRRILNFSRRGLRELLQWFEKLLLNYPQRLCVVIDDRQDLEIPWETLSPDGKTYLGAQATIVRWKPVEYFSDVRLLNVCDIHRQGTIIAYLDEQDLGAEGHFPERDLLKALNVEHYKRLEDMARYLAGLKSLDSVGLIYLGSHSREEALMDALQELFDTLASFDGDGPRPIVFVNACNSARAQSENLMDALLSNFASSYVGTLGMVEPVYASQVATRILQEATRPEGVCIAEVLRDLRAEVLQEIKAKQLITKDLLHAFMYVYYGNPLLCLRLVGPKEPEVNA